MSDDYRTLLESLTQAIWEMNAAGRVVSDSPSWCAYTGQTRQQWLTEGWMGAVHPADQDQVRQQWQEALTAQTRFDAECRLSRPMGDWGWANVRAIPILNPDGSTQKWMGMTIDISQRKQEEEALKEDYAQLLLTTDAAQAGRGTWAFDTGAAEWDTQGRQMIRASSRFRQAVDGMPLMGAGLVVDIADQTPTQRALQEKEARQALLLQLSDQLRPLTDPDEIYYQAASLLGEYLGANRVGYAEDQGDGQTIRVRCNYIQGVTNLQGIYPYADYGPLLAEFVAGRTVVRPDVAADPSLTDVEKQAHAVLQLGATLNKPLIKDGRLVSVLFIHYIQPHHWTANELSLLDDVADRIVVAVERARAAAALCESEERLRLAVAATGLSIFDWDLTTDLVTVNERFKQLLGLPTEQAVMGVAMMGGVVHPQDQDWVSQRIGQACDPHSSGSYAFEHRALTPTGVRWLLTFGQAYFTGEGEERRAVRIIGNQLDITERKQAEQAIRQSEARFRSLIREAPIAMLVYEGPDQVMVEANQEMLAVFGRGDAVVGKPLLEAVPELKETGLPGYYQQVLATGEPYHHPAERVLLMKNGQPYWGYYNYTYKPLYDEQGAIYGVICTSLDVTAEVAAQQALANSEARLQNAVDLAELATWHADVPSGQVTFSARFHEWMGLGQQTRIEDAFDAVAPSESARIKKAFQRAISEPLSGQLDVEFPVTNSHTGQSRLVRIVGQTQRDEQGQPLSIHGFAQDVTQLRAGQQALESLVEERTNELAVANQELAAANCLLTQSNNNLQTFAYVASHDLQEPLRKIQQFGDLLNQHYADDLGEGKIYVERMQSAASRMSTLIRDLLDYSRIATQRDKSVPVALNRIVDQVLRTLDWTIQEAGAQIQIDSLPTLSGDRSQLGQLFQNLLSNALKFRQADKIPLIQVRAQAVAAVDLPSDVKPSRVVAQYYRLDVRDNGVGFDEKYLDRIFQVFQRLHDKKEFAGTGIGLAICEKVVTNHGGVITASSQPGQGATFSIYLPAE